MVLRLHFHSKTVNVSKTNSKIPITQIWLSIPYALKLFNNNNKLSQQRNDQPITLKRLSHTVFSDIGSGLTYWDIFHNHRTWTYSRAFATRSVSSRFTTIIQNDEERELLQNMVQRIVAGESSCDVNALTEMDRGVTHLDFRSKERRVFESLINQGMANALIDQWINLVAGWADRDALEQLLEEEKKTERINKEKENDLTELYDSNNEVEDYELVNLVEQIQSLEEETVKQLGLAEEQRQSGRVSLTGAVEDERSAVIEICPGLGGAEAVMLRDDLMNVYKLYCQRRGWCYASADRDEDNDDNFDRNKRAVRVSRTLTVNGIGAYGDFQYEAGVHRFIRKLHLSVQTSSLLVIVIPQADPIQNDIPINDLQVDYSIAGGPGGSNANAHVSKVRILHKPSGITVLCRETRSPTENYDIAMKVLKARVQVHYKGIRAGELSQFKKGFLGTGETGEKIRTYDYERNRIVDHRCHLTVDNVEGFMETGNRLEDLINHLRNRRLVQSAIAFVKRFNRAITAAS